MTQAFLPGIEQPQAMTTQPFSILTEPAIVQLLANNAPVAIGVSGGKDSGATALAVTRYLTEIGHAGPCILIHSDLGRVEWRESLPMCQKLADFLRMDLVVVRRQAGDLMDRWLVRWQNNLARYRALECVKLILPWSTASMRFCTSEMKSAICSRYLVERFPKQTILSVSGIRRQESPARSHAPVSQAQLRLTSATFQTRGYDWHPLLSWTVEEVLAYHKRCGFPLHEAYGLGSSRVSCVFCILASYADLLVSTGCPEHQALYREIVDLEICSSFSFKGDLWLGDVAPHLLTAGQQRGLAEAKRRAAIRGNAEARIPRHLLYCKGWPTVMPTLADARLLAEVRCTVADTLEIVINYRDAESIQARYAELMAKQVEKKRTQPTKLTTQPIAVDLWQTDEEVAS
jgi:3'-phosphoadenosine 5'-phosphosulfate sulfotransferase (PAPS reductase)/FAD synthetase